MNDIIDEFKEVTVLVVGDPMLDVYHSGYVERISPEAPVPVFVEITRETRMGGAANVAANVRALGCNVKTHFPTVNWGEKHRYMAGSHHLLRIDDDVDYEPPTSTPDLTGIDAVILSDYDKGWLDREFVADLILACRVHTIPVVVDPKGEDFSKYRGCTIICPNTYEAENVVMNDFPTILFKLGERGLLLHGNGNDKHFPATAKAVFDVCGAGDTVVAVIGACLAAGINLHTAAELANLAAGHVVGQVGTATCSADQLRALL